MRGRSINITAGSTPEIPRGAITAPERFRIWKQGDNPGDYGSNILTPEAAQRVLDQYLKRGNPLGIDVEHNTNRQINPDYDPADPPKTGGYCGLVLVETPAGVELWADPVRWSEYAREQIEGGERCCISPDWELEVETQEPLWINRLSLVFEPGTWGIGLLASKAAGRVKAGKTMDLNTLKQALVAAQSIADTAEDQEMKTLAADFASKLSAMASALGLDLAGQEAPSEPAAEPAPDLLGGVMDEQKPAATKAASKGEGLTLVDVQKVIREEQAKQAMIASATNRPGMTPALKTFLASKSFAEVKAIVSALPIAPAQAAEQKTASKADDGSVHRVPVTETKNDELNAEEAFRVSRFDKQLGLSADRLAASKAAVANGTAGVTSVAKLREIRRAAK